MAPIPHPYHHKKGSDISTYKKAKPWKYRVTLDVEAESYAAAVELINAREARVAALERVVAFVEDVIVHRPCGSVWYADALERILALNDPDNAQTVEAKDGEQ